MDIDISRLLGRKAILVSFELEFDAMEQGLALLLFAGETSEDVQGFVGLLGMGWGRHCARRVGYSRVDIFVDSVFFIGCGNLGNFLRFCL